MNLEEYKKNEKINYQDYTKYLQEKYGIAKKNYMTQRCNDKKGRRLNYTNYLLICLN